MLFDFSLQNGCLEAGALLSLSRQEAGQGSGGRVAHPVGDSAGLSGRAWIPTLNILLLGAIKRADECPAPNPGQECFFVGSAVY